MGRTHREPATALCSTSCSCPRPLSISSAQISPSPPPEIHPSMHYRCSPPVHPMHAFIDPSYLNPAMKQSSCISFPINPPMCMFFPGSDHPFTLYHYTYPQTFFSLVTSPLSHAFLGMSFPMQPVHSSTIPPYLHPSSCGRVMILMCARIHYSHIFLHKKFSLHFPLSLPFLWVLFGFGFGWFSSCAILKFLVTAVFSVLRQ